MSAGRLGDMISTGRLGESRYGDKAGWLKKKRPAKDWETHFCVVRGSILTHYEDEEMTVARGSVELRGAQLEHKLPRTCSRAAGTRTTARTNTPSWSSRGTLRRGSATCSRR